MRIVVQIIQNFLKQEIPTILITTDTNRYLFNVPPSFQRFTKQHKVKFPIGGKYFFTKTSTNSITGLTGLFLTLASQGGISGTKLYTDQKLFKYMQQLRYKMGFKAVPLSYCSWQGKLRKGMMNTSHLLELSKQQNFAQIFQNMGHFIDQKIVEKEQNNAYQFYNEKDLKFKDEDLQILPFFINQGDQVITNYIIIPKPLPGNFMPQKLKQFGIQKHNIALLIKQGFLQIDGHVIKIQQVKEKDSPSPHSIILHYKQAITIDKIAAHPRLLHILENKLNCIHSVFHIVQCAETIISQKFRHLLSLFPSQTHHVVYNNKFRNSTDNIDDLIRLSSSVRMVSDLHKHFPLCMPDLYSKHESYIKEYLGKTQAIDKLLSNYKVSSYKRCHEMILAPKKSWGYKSIPSSDKKQSKIQPPQSQSIQVLEELSVNYKNLFQQINPKIIFLGTGSMKPSRYRNVSSIMVEWLPNFNMMFDCGEGSHIQLIDHYGYEDYPSVIVNLRVIFITHIHSDHNLGLLDLISQRTRVLKQRGVNPNHHKLFLILPANVVPWYHSFCKNIQNLNQGCQVIFIQALRNEDYSFEGTMSKQSGLNKKCSVKSDMVDQSEEGEGEQDQLDFIRPQWNDILKDYFQNQQLSLEEFKATLKTMGIDQFYPCPVIHCPQSYGICIKHQSGFKLSYSGDTRPCTQFANAAKNSTLLIHEATFGDDLERNAFDHFHSTVGQAMDIAMKSESWKLALTHFSQRYKSAQDIVDPRNYLLNKAKRLFAEKDTIVCFDHLQIEMSKAHLMPSVSRAIAAAIPKESNRQ